MAVIRLTLDVPDQLFSPIEATVVVTEAAAGEEVELEAAEYRHAPEL